MQQRIELLGVDLHQGFPLGDHALLDQVDGDLHGGSGCALAVSGLQHEELAALDREFHVLHVFVMLFQRHRDLHELLVDFGHDLAQLVDRLRRADAGDDILALGVHQEFAVQLVLAGGRVAGKGHAGAGCIAHVAVDHFLDVDGCAPTARDIIHAAVDDRALVVPGTENGFDRLDQLLTRILREIEPLDFFIESLVAADNLFHGRRVEIGVQLGAGSLP